MGVYGYLLDVLVPKFNLRKTVIQDPKDVNIEIEFPLATLTLTSSRLNLMNFCGDAQAKFEADSATIRDDLTNNPLKVTVRLKDQVVGKGEIPWPKKIVDGIAENMEVITEGANTLLTMEDKVVGCVEVILRIQGCCNKCQLDDENNENEGGEDNEINPNDIMFLMGDEDACKKPEPEAPEDPCKNRLNLSDYRDSNGKIILDPEFHNACTSPQCIALKQMGGNLERIVNSLVSSGLQDVRANRKKPKCCNPCELKKDPCTGMYVCEMPNCNICQRGSLDEIEISVDEIICLAYEITHQLSK